MDYLREGSTTKCFHPAFVDSLPAQPDVVVKDVSALIRSLLQRKEPVRTWQEFRETAGKIALDELSRCNTLLLCCDYQPLSPACKEVKRRLDQRSRNTEPLAPFTEAEMMMDCVSRRNGNMPSDIDRMLITEKMKVLLTAEFGRACLDACKYSPQLDPPKSIIVDGMLDRFDPLSSEPAVPMVFRKHSANGGELQRESGPPIGESDLRWVRWLYTFSMDKTQSALFGVKDPSLGPLILLDMNDSDMLPIALLNIKAFVPRDGNPRFRLFMHHGRAARWCDFLPYNQLEPEVLERCARNKMLDLLDLYCLILLEWGGRLQVGNPVIVFCTLLLLCGSDFAKIAYTNEEARPGPPLKQIGPAAVFKMFTSNQAARAAFSDPIRLTAGPAGTHMPGCGIRLRGHTHMNELYMTDFIRFLYQQILHGIEVDGQKIVKPGVGRENFARLQRAYVSKLRLQADRKRKRNKNQGESAPLNERELMRNARIANETEVVALLRRIYWNVDCWMNEWTGLRGANTDLIIAQESGLSEYGWMRDQATGRVMAAWIVHTG